MATTENDLEIPRPARGEGQWGLGYREPLNPAERIKRDENPLVIRERILGMYAKEGFRSIDPATLRSKMRWWGLYTQRKPGIGGGQTATVEPWELEDEFFMLRIRIDGGQLTADQLRAIAWVSERYGRDVADITDRQNIQLHWIRVEDIPTIWERLEGSGLTTQEACGDTPRVMLGCPLAGVAADEIIDATPAITATVERFVGDPAFSNLPRKYKTTMSGCRHQCVQPETNDISFVGTEKDGKAGFQLWIGGGLSTNPHFAKSLGVFVTIDEIPEIWEAATSVFRDFGYRRRRNHARVKFLMADWGPEKYREVMEKKYLGRTLEDGPEPVITDAALRDHVGVFEQHDGNRYVGFAPKAGRIYGHQLRQVADLAERYGSGRTRTTSQQKLVILDVPEANVEPLVAALENEDLQVNPSTFRKGMMACTGIEFCKLAIVETKQRAQWLYAELEERMPGFNEEIHINVNGCPNSCARFQIADIGLMGASLPRPDGTKSDGFLINLGGGLGQSRAFGRRAKGVRVYAEDIADFVEELLTTYQHRNADAGFKGFSDYVNSLEDADLTAFAASAAATVANR